MNEKLNFFEALGELVGTDRKIRYISKHKVKNIWHNIIASTSPNGTSMHLEDSARHVWWPTIKQQKEKAWEVEPEEITVVVWTDNSGQTYLSKSKEDKDSLHIGDHLTESQRLLHFKLVPIKEKG